jgi:hypothetical protein
MANGTEGAIAARDDNRKLALLVAINRIPKPTERDLIEATNIPQRCVHSMFKSLSRMSVVIERVNGRRHGYYTIADSGAFDLCRAPDVLQYNYPEIFQQIEHIAQKKEVVTLVRNNIDVQGECLTSEEKSYDEAMFRR